MNSQGPIGSHLNEEDIRSLLVEGGHSNQKGDRLVFGPAGDHGPYRSAAVLIPLYRANEEWQILFTRRTDDVQDHKGQVAFPGGSTEPEDANPIDTALREADEEIGLDPKDVFVLGQMQAMITGTGYSVTPVVGIIPWPYSFSISILEVSRIFSVPLAWLADPTHYEQRIFYRSESDPTPHQAIFFEPYDGETLWGVSARITLNFLTVLHLIESEEN